MALLMWKQYVAIAILSSLCPWWSGAQAASFGEGDCTCDSIPCYTSENVTRTETVQNCQGFWFRKKCGEINRTRSYIDETYYCCDGFTQINDTCYQRVDGAWSEWGEWSECCSVDGEGSRSRERQCDSPEPGYGAVNCTGLDYEQERCEGRPCLEGGDWSEWQAWDSCSVTCGPGTRNRTRSCASSSTGREAACDGENWQAEQCLQSDCVEGGGDWSEWQAWDSCSFTCGPGTRNRTRSCASSSTGREAACDGENWQAEQCLQSDCVVEGGWSSWGEWTPCTATCGSGITQRTRNCTSPTPTGGGLCEGVGVHTARCLRPSCAPAVIEWSEWGPWCSCSVTCGTGFINRTRTCTSTPPSSPSTDDACPGDSFQTAACQQPDCDEPCACSSQPCAVYSNVTRILRQQTCTGPWYSSTCSTKTKEIFRAEMTPHCCASYRLARGECYPRVDGGWSQWGAWGPCDVTCGLGSKERRRECSSPPPRGGRPCVGNTRQNASCAQPSCTTPGSQAEDHELLVWSAWEGWGACSVSCDTGTRSRTRTCGGPSPGRAGDCPGNASQVQPCEAASRCPKPTALPDVADEQTCGPAGCSEGSATNINVHISLLGGMAAKLLLDIL